MRQFEYINSLLRKKNGREKGLSCFPAPPSLRRLSKLFLPFFVPHLSRMRVRPEKLRRVI